MASEAEPAEERSWTGWVEIEDPGLPEDGAEPATGEDELPEY